MTINEQLALRIIEKRKRLRLTQTELAKKAGISRTAVARIEEAKGNPTIEVVQKLANALDLSLTLHAHPSPQPQLEAPAWLDI